MAGAAEAEAEAEEIEKDPRNATIRGRLLEKDQTW